MHRTAVVCQGVRVKDVDAEAAVLALVREELPGPAAVVDQSLGVD